MGRKPLWKDIFIASADELGYLQSYYQSCKGAWAKYTVDFMSAPGHIETNVPYSELRRWFRFALDKPLPDHVTSELPSWELYKDD